MADYSFGGSDEENAELKKLNIEVVQLDSSARTQVQSTNDTPFVG